MKKLKFESAIERLEEIVAKLESGDIDLNESMELFKEGVSVAGFCSNELSKAEQMISELSIQSEEVKKSGEESV